MRRLWLAQAGVACRWPDWALVAMRQLAFATVAGRRPHSQSGAGNPLVRRKSGLNSLDW